MGSTVHSRTKLTSIFFFMFLYDVYVLVEVRASSYQLNLQKQIHFGMWNIMMVLCLGWKCLKVSFSSSFLQQITSQDFKYDLMIKASFNRMYYFRHKSVLETADFFVLLAMLLQKVFLTENVQLRVLATRMWVSSCKFLFFLLVEVMVNLIGYKLVSLLASFLVLHLYFCVQTSSPNESFSYYWNMRRSGHLSQSAWAAAFVPRTF